LQSPLPATRFFSRSGPPPHVPLPLASTEPDPVAAPSLSSLLPLRSPRPLLLAAPLPKRRLSLRAPPPSPSTASYASSSAAATCSPSAQPKLFASLEPWCSSVTPATRRVGAASAHHLTSPLPSTSTAPCRPLFLLSASVSSSSVVTGHRPPLSAVKRCACLSVDRDAAISTCCHPRLDVLWLAQDFATNRLPLAGFTLSPTRSLAIPLFW
jgi:hypothetical protein